MLPDGFIQQRAPDTGAQREAGGAVPQAEVAQHEGPHLRAQLLQAHYAPDDGVSMFVALLAQVGHPDLGRGMPKSPAFLTPGQQGSGAPGSDGRAFVQLVQIAGTWQH